MKAQREREVGAVRKILSVRRVFGDPIEVDGATIIPAARVKGAVRGRGRGRRKQNNGDHGAEDFAVNARPAGAFVVRDGNVSWQPAVDVNRIVAGGQLLGLMGLITFVVLRVFRLRPRRRR